MNKLYSDPDKLMHFVSQYQLIDPEIFEKMSQLGINGDGDLTCFSPEDSYTDEDWNKMVAYWETWLED